MQRRSARPTQSLLWLVACVASLGLCSCRSAADAHRACPGDAAGMLAACDAGALDCPASPPLALNPDGSVAPLPYQVQGPWTPPGLSQPWPPEEYLRDGGDAETPATVNDDATMGGLEVEDTVAQFATLDGRTLIEPSNRVHIYAPRFGVVRTVASVDQSQRNDVVGAAGGVQGHRRREAAEEVASRTKQARSQDKRLARLGHALRTKQSDGAVSSRNGLVEADDHEAADVTLNAQGDVLLHQDEAPRLAAGKQAAIAWSTDEGVEVLLGDQFAIVHSGDRRAEAVFEIDDRRHHPRLRVVKTASIFFAEPGDFVDFTIRFENVGDQPLVNVALLDNLTTRLEYVPHSSQASVEAQFSHVRNEADSHVLRWDMQESLLPGEGGVLHFRCRVR